MQYHEQTLRREFALRLALGTRQKAPVRLFDIYPAFVDILAGDSLKTPCLQTVPPA
jgi:hypothetical protein